MPGIKGCPTVETCDPVKLFGQVVHPEETIGETMREAAIGTTVRYEGCRVDSATDLLTLTPTYGPKDMKKADWSCVGGTVKEMTDRSTGRTVLAQVAAPANVEWTATAGASMSGNIIPAGGGWYLGLGKSAPLPGAAESYLRVEFATGATTKLRIDWDAGKRPCVMAFDGTSWSWAGDITTDATKAMSGAASRMIILIQLLDVYIDPVTLVSYGKLAIRAGQGGDFNDKALVLGYHDLGFPVKVLGKNVNASFYAGPVTYAATGGMISGIKEKSSGNDSLYTVYVSGTTLNGQLDGIDASAWSVGGNPYACQYQLDLTAKAGSVNPDGTEAENSVTPWVRSVVVQQDTVEIAPALDPGWTPIGYVEHVHTESEFIPGEGQGHTVAAYCDITLRNQEGQQAGPTGAKAMRVIGNLYDEHNNLLWSQGLFLGYVNLRSRINPWSMVSEGVDRSVQLRAKKIHLDMYLDGQCIYHAAKRLAQRGGITQAWLHLSPNNPADAWNCDGQTCNHPRLPMGTAAEPLVRIPPGTSVWDALGMISQGYAYGFTVDGKFSFYSWEPWTARDDWQPRQIFSMVPEIDWFTGAPYLNEILDDFTVTTDLTNTKNALSLIGWDRQSWLPFVVRRYDPEGVAGGYGTARYQGFLNEWAWSDAMFCDPTFTDMVANRIFTWVSQPQVTAQFRCWPLPLFALDYIGITANRAWPWDEKWWLRRVTQDWDAQGEYVMDVTAGLIPLGLTAQNPALGEDPAMAPAPDGGSGTVSTLGTTDEDGNPTAYAMSDQPRTGTSVAAPSQGDTFGTLLLAGDAMNAESTTTAPYRFGPNQLITADRLNTHADALEAMASRVAPRPVSLTAWWPPLTPVHTVTLPCAIAPGFEDAVTVNGQPAYAEVAADRLSLTFKSEVVAVPTLKAGATEGSNDPADYDIVYRQIGAIRTEGVPMAISYMGVGGTDASTIFTRVAGSTVAGTNVSTAVLDVPVRIGCEGQVFGWSSLGPVEAAAIQVSSDRTTITYTIPATAPPPEAYGPYMGAFRPWQWRGPDEDWIVFYYIAEEA